MDIYLLFRKKSPLTEEGLPWMRGARAGWYLRAISEPTTPSQVRQWIAEAGATK